MCAVEVGYGVSQHLITFNSMKLESLKTFNEIFETLTITAATG